MGIEIVFTQDVDKAMKAIKDTIDERMLEAANNVRNATLETLAGNRTGRVYKVPGTQRLYTASAPGEPPAVQLGDLRKSIKFGVEKEDDNTVGYVGTEMDKGPMLEFGTSKMEARPWLRPSFEKSEDAVKEIFTRIWF